MGFRSRFLVCNLFVIFFVLCKSQNTNEAARKRAVSLIFSLFEIFLCYNVEIKIGGKQNGKYFF